MPTTPTPRSDPRPSPYGSAESQAVAADAGPLDIGRPYFRAVRTHWPFAALFVVAVVVGTLLVLSLRSPSYEATAEVLVTPVDPTDTNFSGLPVLQELGDPTRTIQTAAALVESREIADAAADRLGDPWTGSRVERAITVSPQGQTNVLEIRASTDDAGEAADVANAYATAVTDVRGLALRDEVDRVVDRLRSELAVLAPEAVATRETLQQRVAQLDLLRVSGDPTVSVVQPASVPSSSDGLPPVLVLVVAVAAALVLAPATALLVELLGPRRVRGDGDLAGAVAGPVLVCVPPDRPSWQRPVAASDDAQRAAYRGFAVRIEFAPTPPRTIMVVSPSRGDGRTSVVANLARELARSGGKVAVADLDVDKPDLTTTLTPDSMPVLRLDPDDGPDTYASPAELVRDAARVYDHLVIDTPPLAQSDEVLRLAAEVDAVIVVARRDHTLLSRLEEACGLLVTVGATPSGGVLLNAPR
jgi:capsular polysaccharide biosynthesis protein